MIIEFNFKFLQSRSLHLEALRSFGRTKHTRFKRKVLVNSCPRLKLLQAWVFTCFHHSCSTLTSQRCFELNRSRSRTMSPRCRKKWSSLNLPGRGRKAASYVSQGALLIAVVLLGCGNNISKQVASHALSERLLVMKLLTLELDLYWFHDVSSVFIALVRSIYTYTYIYIYEKPAKVLL